MKKRRAEELLGQSLYEELGAGEREELQRLLEDQPSLRSEAAGLEEFVGRIAAGPVVFRGDLRPAVIAELSRRGPRRAVFLPRWFLAAAAFALVASGTAYWIIMHPPAAVAPGVTLAGDAAPAARSPALAEAEALIASRQYAQAYAALAKAVESAPRAPDAALACQTMAELAFVELQWYPEAFAGYDKLRRDYAGQFRADKHNFTRLNLLDEARGPTGEYASLRALDAARREGRFEAYEGVLAKYPATYVASAAAGELATVVARTEGLAASDYTTVRALRMAQFRLKDPIAQAQLRIEIAHALRADPGQAGEARRIYEEIAAGPYTTLSELAKKSLSAMDAPEAPRDPAL
jgi:hypothetical protein